MMSMFYKMKFSHFIGVTANTPNAAFYYDKDISNVLKGTSFGFILKDLKHDTAFVDEVMSKVRECVKGHYMHITKVK